MFFCNAGLAINMFFFIKQNQHFSRFKRFFFSETENRENCLKQGIIKNQNRRYCFCPLQTTLFFFVLCFKNKTKRKNAFSL